MDEKVLFGIFMGLSLFGTACGGAVAAPGVRPVSVTTLERSDSLVRSPSQQHWTGSFRIAGQPMQDTCNEEIYLAVRNITIGEKIAADVVNREYDIVRADAESLTAEGRFAVDICGDAGRIFERWELSRNSDGFSGTLESTWPLPSDCSRSCSVTFQIEGQQARH